MGKSFQLKLSGNGQAAVYCLVGFLIAVTFSSCIYSDYPLTARGTKDDRICGHWRLIDDKAHEQVELTITEEKDNWYRIREREPGPGDKEHISTDRCYPTLTKDNNFLNIELRVAAKQQDKKPEQSVQKFMFCKYEITKDDLWIWNIDEQELIIDVRSKKLSGEVDNATTPWRIVRLHDTAANILKYFSERSKSTLFIKAGHFKRVS